MGTLSRAHCPPTQYCSSLFVDKVIHLPIQHGTTLCLLQTPAHQSRLEASPGDSGLDFLLVNLLIKFPAYSPDSRLITWAVT